MKLFGGVRVCTGVYLVNFSVKCISSCGLWSELESSSLDVKLLCKTLFDLKTVNIYVNQLF